MNLNEIDGRAGVLSAALFDLTGENILGSNNIYSLLCGAFSVVSSDIERNTNVLIRFIYHIVV